MPKENWQPIATERQAHRDSTIRELSTLPDPIQVPDFNDPSKLPLNVYNLGQQSLSPREIEITEKSPTILLVELAKGSLSAVEVTRAFLKRAAIAQKLTNCATELLPTLALSRAEYLDNHLTQHHRPIGALHGLPISVKEHIGIKSHDLNAGFVSWVGNTATEHADILKPLYDAGAIFYVRTTEPQTLMHLETSSNLYGVTVNPFNRNLTSGGSSGGEGALLGMRGSCLGIGTDIGGSIRSPAGNNGVYGLRPTSYRLPMGGQAATMLGQEHIVPVVGPLSTRLTGLSTFMSAVLSTEPWLTDPMLVPIPWREKSHFPLNVITGETRRIKIGVMKWDGVVMPHPPVLRVMEEVVQGLKHHPGHFEVVEWEETEADRAWDIISALYFADGATEEKEAIRSSGEPILPLSEWILTQPNVPNPPGHTVQDLWDLTRKRDDFRKEYLAKWLKSGIDVLLCPVGPGVAPRLGTAKYWGYTSLWNLLDYPAVVFPVSRVGRADKGEWEYAKGPGANEKDTMNMKLWDPEYFTDAPISLQLVGRRFDDEMILEALEIMQGQLDLPFVDAAHVH
ncbi:Acetamidase [Arthrobotrys entomopaga]|nr:Acetamidase [Arthrobotrys entomopaga]